MPSKEGAQKARRERQIQIDLMTFNAQFAVWWDLHRQNKSQAVASAILQSVKDAESLGDWRSLNQWWDWFVDYMHMNAPHIRRRSTLVSSYMRVMEFARSNEKAFLDAWKRFNDFMDAQENYTDNRTIH